MLAFEKLAEFSPAAQLWCEGARVVYANPAARNLLGVEQDQTVSEFNLSTLFDEDSLATLQGLRLDPPSPQPPALTAQLRRGDGVWLSVNLQPAFPSPDSDTFALYLASDGPQAFDTYLAHVVESVPTGVIMLDAQGRIILVNRELESMFAYRREELLGQPVELLLPERYREGHRHLRRDYLVDPTPRAMGAGRELFGRRKDGSEFPVEIGLNPTPVAGGTAVVASVVDISERKHMELDLRQANANLEEFTYVASHDLKSPLRGIADLVEWISEDMGKDKPAEVAHNLERVGLRIKRLEHLIDDLLAYARAGRTATEQSNVVVSQLIDGILEIQSAPPGFRFEVQAQVPPFRTARVPLETALRNLIGNAVKHHDRNQGLIRIGVEADDGYYVFSIADDGPGIPPKARDRMFKLFQTLTTAERGGSGIGLALTKRLVESHGGRIQFEAQETPRGATFRFWWPRYARREVDD